MIRMYHIHIRLKVISHSIFNNFVHEVKLHDVEFSTCDILMSVCKKKNLGSTSDFEYLGTLTLYCRCRGMNKDLSWRSSKECQHSGVSIARAVRDLHKPLNFNRELEKMLWINRENNCSQMVRLHVTKMTIFPKVNLQI